MKDKDPYNFKAAVLWLKDKNNLKKLKESLQKETEKAKCREKNRIVTEEQWRTLYDI